MKLAFRILRLLSRHTWWWTAGLIVLLALTLTAARLLLPQLHHYKSELEVHLSGVIGQPVSVRDFEIGWHGFSPRLLLRDLSVMDRSGESELFGFQSVYVDISLPLSLYRGQIALQDLTLTGLNLSLVRDEAGAVSLEGVILPDFDQAGTGDGTAVFDWLLRQTSLVIERSTLHWHDRQRDNNVLTFTDVNVSLRNHGERHRLSGQVTLPPTMGGRVQLIVEAQGGEQDWRRWPVDFYLKGERLQLTQWLADQPRLGVRLVNASTDLALWGRWRDGALDDFRGDVRLADLYLVPESAAGPEPRPVSLLSGQFVWQRQAQGWQLDIDRLRLVLDEVAWQPARVWLRQQSHDGIDELELASSFARLDDVAALLLRSSQLSDEQRQLLETSRPRGELHDGYFKLRRAGDRVESYFARAELKRLALLPWRNLPGFDGLDARLNLDQSGGVAEISSRGAYLDLKPLFRDFFTLDSLAGRLDWRQRDDGLLLDLSGLDLANRDAAVSLGGQLFLPADGSSPLAKLLLDIKRGNGKATSAYLPVKIMHPNAVEWLDRGIVAGDVTSGSMILQGPLKRFPFADGSGRFEIRFDVKNGVIDYRRGWPRVERAKASVAFIGKRMEINASSGRILGADIGPLKVEIPDMLAHPALLHIDGKAKGSTANAVRFLNESPLGERLGNFSAGAVAEGKSSLDLSLVIPLTQEGEVSTRGVLGFSDSKLDLKRLGIDMAAMSGVVVFTGKGLSGEGVQATVLGQPALIDIRTDESRPGARVMRFEAAGESRLAALAKRIELPIFPYLQGDSPWQAQLDIPLGQSGAGAAPTLILKSNLRGTQVVLPPPLAKEAAQTRNLELQGRFDDKAQLWAFDYGAKRLTGVFDLPAAKERARAELRFGAPAQLPDAPGLRLAGRIERFAYDEWRSLIAPEKVEGKKAAAPGTAMRLNRLDMQAGQVEWFGQVLDQAAVQAVYANGLWRADVDSQQMKGKVWLPENSNQVLELELERLYLSKRAPAQAPDDAARLEAAKARSAALDPSEFPPLTLRSKETRYGDLTLGQVELKTRRRPSGFDIETLSAKNEVFQLQAQGAWIKPRQHSSSISADIRINDLGELLGRLGYVEAIKHGNGNGKLKLNWAGPLTDYDLASMNGTLDFDFNDGRLLEVEPGAGRLFGLLSIQALPRRLTLDFSDFFGKGYAFDHMRGHFDIRKGNAYTENFELDGPAARMELSGRVGLLDEDYDQRVKVIPHVTSGLPAIAGVLTGSIAPALVVALIEKLTKSEVDKVTGISYQVTGKWSKPVVEPVGVVKQGEAGK